MPHTYTPPVASLLELGAPNMTVLIRDWIDYEGKYKLSKEQIPELIRMSVDEDLYNSDPEGTEIWSAVHAWRALAQLQATEAVAPLLKLMNREEAEWEQYEMFYIMGMIGFPALDELVKFVADTSNDEFARCRAIECIAEIGHSFWIDPERKTAQALIAQLEKYADNTPDINNYLIRGLAELHAVFALPLITKIFTEQKVGAGIEINAIRERIERPQ
jgi:HEAT repeat protein